MTALPRPSEAEQQSLHGESAYFEHPYFDARRRRDLVERRCRETFARVYAGTDSAAVGVRHLDVGCDTGEFLLAAERLFGSVPTGVEIAPLAAEAARAQGVTVHLSPVEALPDEAGPFDLITAIDLVEHLVEPCAFFAAARRLLSEGGVLYVETPNPSSLVYRLGRRLSNATSGRPRWVCQRLFLPEHIQYFTEDGLLSAAEGAGLTPRTVQTRRLAGRYVSAGLAVRTALSAIQSFDRPKSGTAVLTWGTFGLA